MYIRTCMRLHRCNYFRLIKHIQAGPMTGPYRACMKFEDVQKLLADHFGHVSSYEILETAFPHTQWSFHTHKVIVPRISVFGHTDGCNSRPLSRNSFIPFHWHSTTCCSWVLKRLAQRDMLRLLARKSHRFCATSRSHSGNDTRSKHHVMKSSKPSPRGGWKRRNNYVTVMW